MSEINPEQAVKNNIVSIQSKQKKKTCKNWTFLVNFIDEKFGKHLRYNMFTHILEVSRKFYWDDEEFDADRCEPYPEDSWVYHRGFNDTDLGYIKLELDKFNPKFNFSTSNVAEGVNFVARTNIYNPVRKHLEELPEWDDSESRLDTWLFDICNASGPSREIISLVGRKFILGMVRRAYFPGTKFDNMLIMEGKQGIGKSTFARILAGNDNLFTDDVISDLTDSRQILEKYSGKLVVEIGELGGFSKHDQKLLKRFIVAQVDSGRPAYGRYQMSIPRSFSFIGNTNDGRYFEDETGLRRYWPIRVTDIDNERFSGRYRDQLLAEAIFNLDLDKHYFNGEYELALEREYEEFKKCKLKSSNDYFLFWVARHWDDICNQREKDAKGRMLVSGNWLYEFCISNFEGNFNNKQYALVLQMLGCVNIRKNSGAFWEVPDAPKPYDV